MFRGIIERTYAERDQDHLDTMIINHASMPDRTSAIKSGDSARVVSLLQQDALTLKSWGADYIAIPCNTSHYFLPDINVDVPIVDMIKETARFIAENRPDAKKIGILATDGTVEQGLYHKALREQGLEPFVPDAAVQKIVMDIIYGQIKAGGRGNLEDFAKVDLHMKKNGCDAAVLACTELSVFRANHELDSFYIDAMQVLIDRCIVLCGGKIRGDRS